MSKSFISLELVISILDSEPVLWGHPSPIYRYRIRVYMRWALVTWQGPSGRVTAGVERSSQEASLFTGGSDLLDPIIPSGMG